jgi:peptidoglycan/LPS O-acetylase OafA/YrhL
MLGVVGIHTGAYSLSNPDVNEHLFALLEIFTRFSVPIFFFISAFGLFYKQNLNEPFDYRKFLIRRCRGVLLPYVLWSLIYMIHYSWASGDLSIWSSPVLAEYFFFGLASYQLYFLVILLWFYLLMPFWRMLLIRIQYRPMVWLSMILLAQIAFNYYSSYIITPGTDNHYLNLAIQHRLSYWVFHYVFIFLLGAICAIHFEKFSQLINRYRRMMTINFGITAATMLAYYYSLLYLAGYSPEAAVNTVHQLSPPGVLYTAAATLFWYAYFSTNRFAESTGKILETLGKYSFSVYLVHPFVMYYLSDFYIRQSLIMNVPVTLSFMVFTMIISLAFGALTYQASTFFPLLGSLLIGIKTSKAKPGVN